jgi:hypothetical protein
MVPTDEFPPATPETSQLMPVVLEPETTALNCCDCPTCKLTFNGEIDTEIAAGVTDTLALAVAVDWATLCAVTVTDCEGTVLGAVYKPMVEMVPTVALPPTVPSTSQLTAVLLVPETLALNCCDWLTCTLALPGDIESETGVGVDAVNVTGALADIDR